MLKAQLSANMLEAVVGQVPLLPSDGFKFFFDDKQTIDRWNDTRMLLCVLLKRSGERSGGRVSTFYICSTGPIPRATLVLYFCEGNKENGASMGSGYGFNSGAGAARRFL